MRIQFSHELGDMVVDYIEVSEGVGMALRILPSELAAQTRDLTGQFQENFASIIEFKCAGEAYHSQFSCGHSLSGVKNELSCLGQSDSSTENGGREIRTRFSLPTGLELVHVLAWDPSCSQVLRSWVEAENRGAEALALELLSSFSISGISPFVETTPNEVFSMKGPEFKDDGRFRLHRYRSQWANEGYLESLDFEDLLLEPSFLPAGRVSEKFGQVGSMPVRRFFPWVAVEDQKYGLVWGAHLEAPSSWQLEVATETAGVFINGGLADRDFGHWLKSLEPGQSFQTPVAHVSCCFAAKEAKATVDLISSRLRSVQEAQPVPELHALEKSMPIICNEWCTSWGVPSHENMLRLADTLQRHSKVQVLVIDAGWYQPVDSPPGAWANAQGDWVPNPELFPEGIAHTAQAIRDRGLIPGLWFELEVCGVLSQSFTRCEPLFLQRDGVPLTVGKRRFWDMTNPETIALLRERVIGTLKQGGFGYLKIDYNDSIGIGAEGCESLGEKLRQNMLASQAFIAEIQAELPELIIENCSSGGHRLEPSFIQLTDQCSFSDAHETVEIPIVAAELQNLVSARKAQIWAVLRKEDRLQRLHYSMAAGLLGRLCLSGDLNDLSEDQWALVKEGEAFYEQAASIIRNGQSTLVRRGNKSRRAPKGWQAVLRQGTDSGQLLLVVHQFARQHERANDLEEGLASEDIVLDLPEGCQGRIRSRYVESTSMADLQVEVLEGKLTLRGMIPFSAVAFILE